MEKKKTKNIKKIIGIIFIILGIASISTSITMMQLNSNKKTTSNEEKVTKKEETKQEKKENEEQQEIPDEQEEPQEHEETYAEKMQRELLEEEEDQKIVNTNLYKNHIQDFDFSFLKLENTEKNKVYSPISIKYTLAMLSEGANGETKEQIDKVLDGYVNNKFKNSRHISFANALFVKDSFKENIKETYINNIKEKFDAEVIYDSFENATTLNNWVKEKTLNLIDGIISDEDIKSTDFNLINALGIDMEWENKILKGPNDNGRDISLYAYSYSLYNKNIKYASYIGLLDENERGTKYKFNDKIDANGFKIAANINKYNIIEDLGEEKIRQIVTDEYNKWIQEEENKQFAIEDFDSWLNNYIEQIKKAYNVNDKSTDFKFYTDDNVKVFAKELKTYNGMKLEYVGIMPTKENLKTYINNITAKDIENITSNLKDLSPENFKDGVMTEIKGIIPPFNMEYSLDLIKDLKEMGVTNVFNDKSDLKNITEVQSNNLDAKHKSNISFSNIGIKATASTSVPVAGNVSNGFEYYFDIPIETIDLTFDKPFMYIIRDTKTGEIWFTGTVYEPILYEETY